MKDVNNTMESKRVELTIRFNYMHAFFLGGGGKNNNWKTIVVRVNNESVL